MNLSQADRLGRIRGTVVLEYVDPATGRVEERIEQRNFITPKMGEAIAKFLAGQTATNPTHFGFGTGASSPVGTNYFSTYVVLQPNMLIGQYMAPNGSQGGRKLTHIAAYLKRAPQTGLGNLTAELWVVSGTNGQPQSLVAASTPINADALRSDAFAWVFFDFGASPPTLQPATAYGLVLRPSSYTYSANNREIQVGRAGATIQAFGAYSSTNNGASWTSLGWSVLNWFNTAHVATDTAFFQPPVGLGRFGVTFARLSGPQVRLGLSLSPSQLNTDHPVGEMGLFNGSGVSADCMALVSTKFVKTSAYSINCYWIIDLSGVS